MPMIAGIPPATEAPYSIRRPMLAGEFGEFGAALGNQQLVRGDDGFSGLERLANPVAGGLHAADQLDHHIHVG